MQKIFKVTVTHDSVITKTQLTVFATGENYAMDEAAEQYAHTLSVPPEAIEIVSCVEKVYTQAEKHTIAESARLLRVLAVTAQELKKWWDENEDLLNPILNTKYPTNALESFDEFVFGMNDWQEDVTQLSNQINH